MCYEGLRPYVGASDIIDTPHQSRQWADHASVTIQLSPSSISSPTYGRRLNTRACSLCPIWMKEYEDRKERSRRKREKREALCQDSARNCLNP